MSETKDTTSATNATQTDAPAPATATIRRANAADIPELDRLLSQVLEVHHAGRPDLFKTGARKYTDNQLTAMLADDDTPVFVMPDPDADGSPAGDCDSARTGSTIHGSPDKLLGYVFCQFQRHPHDNILTDITTLYIDDLCVDEAARGRGVGSALYRYALDFARRSGCHNLTLNVWSCNPTAQAFYERMGLTPYKTCLEQKL